MAVIQEVIENSEATGLRDIVDTSTNGTLETTLTHDKIEIYNSPNTVKKIVVNYTKKQRETTTNLHKETKGTYTLTDVLQMDEYETDEEGNEIPDTRTTIREENLHLTEWDNMVGSSFATAIINAMRELNGIID